MNNIVDYISLMDCNYKTNEIILSIDISYGNNGLRYTQWIKEKTKPSKLWRDIWKEK